MTISHDLLTQIVELLEKGLSTGKYAYTFREILRKMSKDDSKVKLKVKSTKLLLFKRNRQLTWSVFKCLSLWSRY